jgi:DNA-directed RNA polymerase specialized sigma24 family protein
MRGNFEPNPPVCVWQRDESGASIEADLLDAAQRNWARLLAYAQRQQQDSARAADILEVVLRSISRARRTNGKFGTPIRNLDNYLYSAFIHTLHRQLAREPHIETVGSLQDLDALSGIRTSTVLPFIEDAILIKELMGYMDERTRHMFSLRTIGYSWDEIARILKNTANNAQVLFNQGLKKARSRVMKPKGSNSTSGKGGETDAA